MLTTKPGRLNSALTMLLVAVVGAVLTIPIMTFGLSRGCAAKGYGILWRCDGYFVVWLIGLAIGLVLAGLVCKRYRIAWSWIIIVPIIQLGLLVLSANVWAHYLGVRSNKAASSYLQQSLDAIDFTVYVPVYLPASFRFEYFTPGGGESGSSLAYNNTDGSADTSIVFNEMNIANIDASAYCNKGNAVSHQYDCTPTTDSSGDMIYLQHSLKGYGDAYILNRSGTMIVVNNDTDHPLPESEVIKMIDSLQSQTKPQLQEVLPVSK